LGDISGTLQVLLFDELNLETIAKVNLYEHKSRWLPAHVADLRQMRLFDEGFPAKWALNELILQNGEKVHASI
jgi:hypothetical protein